ncbi:MAG: CinA family protein, partial [Frankia sp.]|nr:CinA family protein [Frankia sp.]
MPEINYRQADVPTGATALPNPRGSAPGLRMELLGVVAYALPGVPVEMEAMFAESVLPHLLQRAGEPAVIVHRVLRTAGMWESAVADAIAPLIAELDAAGNPTIALLATGGLTSAVDAQPGTVRVRITAKATDDAAARALIAPVETAARAALGDAVFGADDDTLVGVVHDMLRSRGATLAVAESLTGGLLGAMLTGVAG